MLSGLAGELGAATSMGLADQAGEEPWNMAPIMKISANFPLIKSEILLLGPCFVIGVRKSSGGLSGASAENYSVESKG